MGSKDFLDALIVGAGFSGLHTLWKLRKLGFSVKIYDNGSDVGGTWFWNRYPGARVDSETPIYQLSEEKEAWIDFEWTQRFPDRNELQRYFHHLDKKLDLSKDIIFNTTIMEAAFDDSLNLWLVKTDTAISVWARHLVLCTGFASKRHTPSFPGLDNFKGQLYHSARWPEEDIDLNRKKVAVIGTGASGVQIIQEIGPIVDHLTVYQRTPNLALPMRQRFLNDGNTKHVYQFSKTSEYEEIFQRLRTSFGAILKNMDFTTKRFRETPPEERQEFLESLWQYGGFAYWMGTFREIYFLQEANDEVYKFWLDKTRSRIVDPVKQDLLAPLTPPHAWGTKRPCLEQAYFEIYNQRNVDLINVKDSPIVEITEQGIKTTKEGVVPVDVLILATGFDSVTGGILNITITNGKGVTLQDKWKPGTSTYLGMTTADFPNLYWFYGPHAPTAFSNGPTCGELQSDWVCDLLVNMRTNGKVRVEALKTAEDQWVAGLQGLWNRSLFKAADSWYQGANIPGKVREPLMYFAGIPSYLKHLEDSKTNNYRGFELS